MRGAGSILLACPRRRRLRNRSKYGARPLILGQPLPEQSDIKEENRELKVEVHG